jgi:hypothetical protein
MPVGRILASLDRYARWSGSVDRSRAGVSSTALRGYLGTLSVQYQPVRGETRIKSAVPTIFSHLSRA